MTVVKKIEQEIRDYLFGEVEITEGYRYSQYRLVRRIGLYANQIYSSGKIDKQGNYKHWFDITMPRRDNEVKNIDFDTKNVMVYSASESAADFPAVFLTNAALREWMRTSGQAEELNSAIEQGSGWGNVLWKKIKGGYERLDLPNVYIVNQTAKTVNDTAVIERHQLTQSDLRAKAGVYKNIDEVIEYCGNKTFSATTETTDKETTSPYYEVFERNGEISEAELFEAQGKKGGDETKYVLARVIVAGVEDKDGTDGRYVLFAEKLSGKMSDVYKEYHRGAYVGRWFRQGIVELLFDCQTRANEIGNQIARGLEWASKVILQTQDVLIAQNILTDLKNGDIVKTKGTLAQVELRMQGIDQLIADWNRNIQTANEIANSREVVTGDSLPSGTPFRLGAMLNQNANKLFDFIREKLAIPLSELFEQWIIPELVKDLKARDVIRLTGDAKYVEMFYQLAVDSWYATNLARIGPHTPELADQLKKTKLDELKRSGDALVKNVPGIWEHFKPRAMVDITGEGVNLLSDLETLYTFISLEQDPVRRRALIEQAMRKKGIDVSSLPKSDDAALAGRPAAAPAQPAPAAQ